MMFQVNKIVVPGKQKSSSKQKKKKLEVNKNEVKSKQ